MDIYLAPDMSLQARRQAVNSNTSTTASKAYVRHLPPKHVDLPLRSTTFVDEEEDFPTPKASQHVQNPMHANGSMLSPGPASSVYSPLKSAPVKSPLRESVLSDHTTFEEDVEASSDNDSEIVPFQVSDSIKKKIARSRATTRSRAPSLIIPSPRLWPNVNRGQQSAGLPPLPGMLSPTTPFTPLSPAALASLEPANLRVPLASTATPSLDGSLTTDERVSFSCPSTPDLLSIPENDDDGKWDLPIQLHPDAMMLLTELSVELPSNEFPKDGPPVVVAEPIQMMERGLSLTDSLASADDLAEAEVSPISIPSPGGFFASLKDGTSKVWLQPPEPEAPNTSTAETFYGVPWRAVAQPTLPQIVEASEHGTDGPPTARRVLDDADLYEEPRSLTLVNDDEFELPEIYAKKVSESAETNKSRTDWWIEEQERYIAKLQAMPAASTPALNSTPEISSTPPSKGTEATALSPPKKTVRFAETLEQPPRPRDSILYHAFQHLLAQEKPRDAFIHRDARITALRMQRLHMKDAHVARLRGAFDLTAPASPAAKPHFLHTEPASPDESAQRAVVASAGKEQRALSQLALSSWTLQAMRYLDGGSLLGASALASLAAARAAGQQPRVLDFGGQPTASWGWGVACAHRDVKVYTAVATGRGEGIRPDWLAHRGPSNHRIASVPNAWTLPFPSDMFSVISARTLHALLRTLPLRGASGDGISDEYDATLRELHRVLAPGGVIEWSLLDAEVRAPANSLLGAKGVEFAVALGVRGFDASAGRKMAGRLDRAGFSDTKSSWVSLPWVGGTSQAGEASRERGAGTDAISGLLGSVLWEQWLLKFQTEAGKSGDALLAGVAEALDEARALHSDSAPVAWRMCVGSARKA